MGNPMDPKITNDPGDPGDPAFWENRYRENDTPWDKGHPHPALEQWLPRLPEIARLHAVVVGCGTGHDVRAAAAHCRRVTGLDVSPGALARAAAHPPVGREVYLRDSVLAPDAAFHTIFDLVIEHTCFCALPPTLRSDYVRGITSLLKPGGRFFGIFYRDPDHGDGPPFGISAAEIDALFDPFFELHSAWKPEVTFPGREGREEIRLYRKRPDTA